MNKRELKSLIAAAALVAGCALGSDANANANANAADPPAAAPAPGKAAPPEHLASIAAKTQGMRAMPGLLNLYWDEKSGKLYLEIPRLNVDLLYMEALPHGVGSNDLGLDRGQRSRPRIVRFERIGPKVLLVQSNEDFRSLADSAPEQLAVRQSFPESVLAGFKAEAEGPAAAGGKAPAVLVDATDFFVRDAHNVAETLARSKQDNYKLDQARSAIALDGTAAFPRNIEVEAILTFAADSVGKSKLVDEVTPDPHAMTVREHQAFIELPGPGFVPRRFDPRAGYFDLTYRDYTTPLGAPVDQQLIVRHRLIKADPACTERCKPLAPIRYYIDRGAPEPIRSALLEGARWWDQAFQAAGWAPGTFQVELLPEGADPMDDRYNIVQWVHRYTRGWSYGFPLADPRTGEIIKGNVTLGSLRGRQDYLIAEALLAPYARGGVDPAHDPMNEMVLARLRLLAAHEVGHTLGLAHNFAASAFPHTPAQIVSVMDYPHPWITLDKSGAPDLSQAYAANIGDWDKVAINYGYRQFGSAADEAAGLERILGDSAKSGLVFISDADARAVSSAHPYAHMWDNGGDPAVELERLLTVRAAALARFGENAIRVGTPMAQLEDTLVPLYLLQRYQVDAAVTEIGGLDYRYQVRGDGSPAPAIVSAEIQQRALTAVLKTLSPEFLTLPESLLKLLPPRPPGLPATREAFPSKTQPAFDPIATAECAADLTLTGLFTPQRAARLVEYGARDPKNLNLAAVIDATLATTGKAPRGTGLVQAVQRAVYVRTVEALLTLAANPAAATEVRAVTEAKLTEVRHHADLASATDAYLAHRIDLFLNDPARFAPSEPLEAPPGMPIGDGED